MSVEVGIPLARKSTAKAPTKQAIRLLVKERSGAIRYTKIIHSADPTIEYNLVIELTP